MAKRPAHRETRYVTILTVHVPDAQAAFDMMRYDRCCPLTEEDSRRLWEISRIGGSASTEDRIIRFMRFAAARNGCCRERWRSFACTVIDERSPLDQGMSDEQALIKLKALPR